LEQNAAPFSAANGTEETGRRVVLLNAIVASSPAKYTLVGEMANPPASPPTVLLTLNTFEMPESGPPKADEADVLLLAFLLTSKTKKSPFASENPKSAGFCFIFVGELVGEPVITVGPKVG
jgi:hypothetical protein